MSDLVALLMSSSAAAKAGVFNSLQSLTYLVLSPISPCTVLTLDDMRLNMFFSLRLYTNVMLTIAMLERITTEEMNRILLILVLK